jgi:hypothetical protein
MEVRCVQTCTSYKNPGWNSGLSALSIALAARTSLSLVAASRLSARFGIRPAAYRRSRKSTCTGVAGMMPMHDAEALTQVHSAQLPTAAQAGQQASA